MAGIWRQNGFIFHIFPDDHIPAHVHVYKAEERVIINIGDATTRPFLRKTGKRAKMQERNVRAALIIVMEKQDDFLAEWRRIHHGEN